MAWLDVNPTRTSDNLVYLTAFEYRNISTSGGRVADVGFSPNGTYLWYLVETTSQNMSKLLNVRGARSVQLAYNGSWQYWNQTWWGTTLVNPFDDNYSRRLAQMSPPPMMPVVVYYDTFAQTKDSALNATSVANSVQNYIVSLGGVVVNQGLGPYVSAKVRFDKIYMIPNEGNVTQVSHDSPVVLFEIAAAASTGSGEPASDSGTLAFAVLFLVIALSPAGLSLSRGRGRARKAFVAQMLVALLVLFAVGEVMVTPASALDISRQAIRADVAPNQGAGITVCVIDTGVDSRNPQLAAAVVGGRDFTDAVTPDFRRDTFGHGTHMAGVVASRSTRYPGIAQQASIYAVKISTVAQILDGIEECGNRAAAFNIRVISLSTGVTHPYSDGTDPLSVAIDNAVERGLTVAVAAGNIDRPGFNQGASSFNGIAIGAVDDQATVTISDDRRACYSSFGTTSDGRRKPDVVAPGGRTSQCGDLFHSDVFVGIWSTRSTVAPDSSYEAVDSDYGRISGTSPATPHVAGQAAIVLVAHPTWTPNQVKDAIRRTARLTSGLNPSEVGFGIVDVASSTSAGVDGLFGWDSMTRAMDWLYQGAYSNLRLRFTYEVQKSTRGDAMLANVWIQHERLQCFFVCWWSIDWSFKLVYSIYTGWIWIDGNAYALSGNSMFSGPRVYAKGPGYEWVKAIYVIQDVRVEVRYMVTSYGMAQIDPWVLVSSVSGARHSYNVLSYYDLDVVGYADDMITRVSDGLIYQTEAKLRNVEVTVRDFSHNTPRVRLLPYGGDNPDEWLLHCCQFYSSDPDLYLNGDSIYRQDIVAYYRATYGLTTAALTGPWLFVEY